MITHAVSVEIDRAITAVFDWLTNAFNHPRWDRSSVEMEPLEPGPWREGLHFARSGESAAEVGDPISYRCNGAAEEHGLAK